MSYWNDRVVLVTGGSSGLGRVIADSFAAVGAKIVIVGLEEDSVQKATGEMSAAGCDALGIQADITQQADVDRLFAEAIARFGKLDVLVNNAGRSMRGKVLDTTPEQFRELMELNIIALVRCTRAAAPHLLAARGHIVNIGSLAAKSASRWVGAYPATKHAVAAYSQQLRLELGPQGLHVLLVCPTPSFVLDTLGMTAMSFGMGALAYWMPDYLETHPEADLFGIERRAVFGIITALAGLGGTLLGGALGDRLRTRLPGSYFLVSSWGLLASGLFVLLFLWAPFPWSWCMIFAAVFFMFLNTGPSNAILANVVHPVMRPAGFALNILVIHAFGDVISPPIIGPISGRWGNAAGFGVVAAFLTIGGLFWLWGARYLAHDTEMAPQRL